MPPAYVKTYVKRGKTDAAEAEAICEAVTRPTMRFVAVKSCEQQAALSMHRARKLPVEHRTELERWRLTERIGGTSISCLVLSHTAELFGIVTAGDPDTGSCPYQR